MPEMLIGGEWRQAVAQSPHTGSVLNGGLNNSGTATNGVDYQTISGTAVIPDGQSSVQVLVTPIDDSFREGTETVTLTPASRSQSRVVAVACTTALAFGA